MVSVDKCNIMTHDNVPLVRSGQRVECSGFYGTIRHIGEVLSTKGTWLGIDWDDPARGKHSGTHEGVKYFETRHPTSGSFVRLEKVNLGKSCPTAIRNRYGEVTNDETAGINKENLALLQREINARFLEVVGFDKVNKKQSQFEELLVVCLREQCVNGPGKPGELTKLCPNIRELDLSRNLINNWYSVAGIARQLRHLRVLNISENQIEVPAQVTELQGSFQSLKHLIMAGVNYVWAQVLECAIMWPDIEVLQVPFNKITNLEPSLNGILQHLKSLDLEGNVISDWMEINKLGTIPCLEYLNVSNVGVSEVLFPIYHSEQKTRLFPALKQIHLSQNKIHNWESVNELNKLLQLEELRFRVNPLLQQESLETSRQLIIASIGNLKVLNGAIITNEERKGAEFDYLKKYGFVWVTMAKQMEHLNHKPILDMFVQSHPRYPLLVDKYGAPDEGEYITRKVTLNTNLITVEIFSPGRDCKMYRKKLPLSMQVQKLIGLVQRLFNTGNEMPELTYISSKTPDVEYPLDKSQKELSFYSIEDGDRINVRW